MAQGLLAAAGAAGLCAQKAGPRPLAYPSVAPEALAYLLYLLREVRFEGTLVAAVGAREMCLRHRLVGRRIQPPTSFHRTARLARSG